MKEISEGGIDGMHSGLEKSNGTKESSEGTTRRRARTARVFFLRPIMNSLGTGVGLQSSTMPNTM